MKNSVLKYLAQLLLSESSNSTNLFMTDENKYTNFIVEDVDLMASMS